MYYLYTRCAGHVRCQVFSDYAGGFVTEALVQFIFEIREQRLGNTIGVIGLSVFDLHAHFQDLKVMVTVNLNLSACA